MHVYVTIMFTHVVGKKLERPVATHGHFTSIARDMVRDGRKIRFRSPKIRFRL
jgi:hypothetical protein